MIRDLKRLFMKKANEGIAEHDDSIERAIKSNDIGLARELVGRRDGIRASIDYLTDAITDLDTEDDDAEDDADKDELAKH